MPKSFSGEWHMRASSKMDDFVSPFLQDPAHGDFVQILYFASIFYYKEFGDFKDSASRRAFALRRR
jgi:hypothetical protein